MMVAFRERNWEMGKGGVEKRFIVYHILFLTFWILYFVHLLPSQKLHFKNTKSESILFSNHPENAYRQGFFVPRAFFWKAVVQSVDI